MNEWYHPCIEKKFIIPNSSYFNLFIYINLKYSKDFSSLSSDLLFGQWIILKNLQFIYSYVYEL